MKKNLILAVLSIMMLSCGKSTNSTTNNSNIDTIDVDTTTEVITNNSFGFESLSQGFVLDTKDKEFGRYHTGISYQLEVDIINKTNQPLSEFKINDYSDYDKIEDLCRIEIVFDNKIITISSVKSDKFPYISSDRPWLPDTKKRVKLFFRPGELSNIHFSYKPQSCKLIIPVFSEDPVGNLFNETYTFDIMSDFDSFAKLIKQ